jgi:hypothetical protein
MFVFGNPFYNFSALELFATGLTGWGVNPVAVVVKATALLLGL